MSEHEVKMIILSTDDVDESIRFYSDTLGMAVKFRDGTHFAALDGGPVTLALATEIDHPIPRPGRGRNQDGRRRRGGEGRRGQWWRNRQGPVRRRTRASGRRLRQQGQRSGVLQPTGS